MIEPFATPGSEGSDLRLLPPDAGVGWLATKPAGPVIGLIHSQSSCRNVVMEMMTGCVDALDGVQERLELK